MEKKCIYYQLAMNTLAIYFKKNMIIYILYTGFICKISTNYLCKYLQDEHYPPRTTQYLRTWIVFLLIKLLGT